MLSAAQWQADLDSLAQILRQRLIYGEDAYGSRRLARRVDSLKKSRAGAHPCRTDPVGGTSAESSCGGCRAYHPPSHPATHWLEASADAHL
jgi:hypothetical protein